MSEKYIFVHLKKMFYTFKHFSQTSYVKKDESTLEKLDFYKRLVQDKLLFYNFNHLIYVLKFIYRSIIMYKSPTLAIGVLKRFLFYKYYNYLRLYLKRN